ncbi:ABC transporter permease [Lapidilactobacillus luobeiensis]|uniref:ABC transporter permease n=1 Tax=Lapidilactobacillus luobeiensis TaxID=2950371 RepID=UPI0021C3A8D1|nr:FtsX-like permease family protein [Lapidilactobacillus luobeiensis]
MMEKVRPSDVQKRQNKQRASKKRLQRQLLRRRIQTNLGRFIAIILIIMLGVLLYVGIKSSGPVLYNNAQTYFKSQKASDIQIVSTTGLTKEDLRRARQLTGATVESAKTVYALTAQDNQTVQLLSLPKKLNRLQVLQGRLPQAKNEIILDELARDDGYRVGSTYRVQKTRGLSRRTFQVVGFARSPLMIDQTARGTTTIGDGTVDYFAYLPAPVFTDNVASTIYLRLKKTTDANPFQAQYQRQVDQAIKQLKGYFKGRASQRNAEILAPTLAQIAAQQTELTNQKRQLSAAQSRLTQQAADAGASLSQAQQAEASRQQATLTAQNAALIAAQKKLTKAKTQATAAVASHYYFNDRQDLPGYSSYGELAERIQAIANVFPLIFFLIAILVTFTTMTRMIEEDRIQIGTMKALGYTRGEIGQGYLTYALLAALCGSFAGIVIGTETLPRIIFKMMQNQFSLPDHGVRYIPLTILIAVLLAGFATLGAVGIAVLRELRERPAELLLPRAPKAGKTILLERFKPLWRRLSFNQKVSYRNLFRFKSRMWMGILGIAGGTGLILAGFGIRDSIAASGNHQFSQVLRYQAAATLTDTKSPTVKKVERVLDADQQILSKLAVHAEQVDLLTNAAKVDTVTLYATSAPQRLQRYIRLSGPLPTNDGVILSEKTARLLKVKSGQTLTIRTSNGQKMAVKVKGVTTNYAGHFIYLTKAYFDQVSSESYQANTWLVRTKAMTHQQEDKFAQRLLASKQVVNVTYLSTQKAAVDKQTAMLQLIVVIFILLSGLLTFIVLYNLTNINVSERIRELSTIKVLGFFDREVTMYIVRENLILTGLGILLGLGFGNLLTLFILHQAETSQVVFPLTISVWGYLVAIAMTLIFTLIVMLVTHRHLTEIDMIAALKAND